MIGISDALTRDGVLVLRGLVEPSMVERVRSDVAPLCRGSGTADKLVNAWRRSDAVRDLATHPEVLAVLAMLYGRRPMPFQTLNLRTGSQQRLHADSIHFDSVPAGWMCGVWVALEDVGPTQGPLTYVPGSHRGPPIGRGDAIDHDGRFSYQRYEEVVEERFAGTPRVEFHAAAGDALVWASNLVHGGADVVDPTSTRWSQVTHYFFAGATYVTPMASDGMSGHRLRDPLLDISTGRRVRPAHEGSAAPFLRLPSGRARLLGPDDPPPAAFTRGVSIVRGAGPQMRWTLARVRWLTRRVREAGTEPRSVPSDPPGPRRPTDTMNS